MGFNWWRPPKASFIDFNSEVWPLRERKRDREGRVGLRRGTVARVCVGQTEYIHVDQSSQSRRLKESMWYVTIAIVAKLVLGRSLSICFLCKVFQLRILLCLSI